MADQIKESRNKVCIDCRGKGSVYSKYWKGMSECIACEGTGKLTESRYQEYLERDRKSEPTPERMKRLDEILLK